MNLSDSNFYQKTLQAPAVPLGDQSITVTSTAASIASLLTAANGAIKTVPSGTKTIWLQPRADGVRYSAGPTTPVVGSTVSGAGRDIFQDGQYPITMSESNLAAVKLVAVSDVVVNLTFEG